MKYLSLLFLLIACGAKGDKDKDDDKKPVAAVPCSVEQLETGALITCPDGSSAFVPKGQNGLPGSNGDDGAKCSIKQVVMQCSDGTTDVLELQ
jgi:hypothetical protein